MMKYQLSNDEVKSIQGLVEEIKIAFPSAESQNFLEEAPCLAHELPRGLLKFLHQFKAAESDGFCLVSGFPIDDKSLGNTPSHWNTSPDLSTAKAAEMLFVLSGAILGDTFSFSSHAQTNKIIHNVLPMKGFETSQLSFSSADELLWHTEDAFHSCRADYLGLMCLRNDDVVPTAMASLEELHLDAELKATLFEKRFLLFPDETHRLSPEEKATPARVSVLFGSREHPYICIDPLFMKGADPVAQAALEQISA